MANYNEQLQKIWRDSIMDEMGRYFTAALTKESPAT